MPKIVQHNLSYPHRNMNDPFKWQEEVMTSVVEKRSLRFSAGHFVMTCVSFVLFK